MDNAGAVVDDTARARPMPIRTFARPFPLAQDQVDLARRMAVVRVGGEGSQQAEADDQVMALFDPVRADDVRVGVALAKRELGRRGTGM